MAKKGLSKVQKIIIIVVSVVIAALLIAGGAYCIATEQNPADAAKSIFSASDDQIVGKWESQKSPGLSAFEFFEDGTYDSYISTAVFSGKYEIDGNKLILKNPTTAKEIVYKFSVNGKELSLKVVEENGEESETKDANKYDRVEELNQKSLTDLLGEFKESSETTTEKDN